MLSIQCKHADENGFCCSDTSAHLLQSDVFLCWMTEELERGSSSREDFSPFLLWPLRGCSIMRLRLPTRTDDAEICIDVIHVLERSSFCHPQSLVMERDLSIRFYAVTPSGIALHTVLEPTVLLEAPTLMCVQCTEAWGLVLLPCRCHMRVACDVN